MLRRTHVWRGWNAIGNASAAVHPPGLYPAALETERLRLRPFRESDLDVYATMLTDPEVTRYLGGQGGSRVEAWRHLAMLAGHWHLKGFGHWAVEVKDSGRFIGRVGLWYPEGWPEYEVGWVVARDAWGHGFATEAARPALHHAFHTFGLQHVISLIAHGNERSVRVAEKLGGRLEKRERFRDLETMFYGYRAG